MTTAVALEITKIINALPDGVKNTDQDFTDSEIYFTKGAGIKFVDPTAKNMFSLVLQLEVGSTSGVIIGSTVTGGLSGAFGTVVGFDGLFIFLRNVTGSFTNGEALSDGAAYNTTVTQTNGVAVTGGKASVLCTRTTTAQFSLKANKSFYASFEAFTPSDPTYQLKHGVKLVDISGDKKVFIEIPENNVEVQAINTDQNGENIGVITSAASFPTHPNYLPLYEIT